MGALARIGLAALVVAGCKTGDAPSAPAEPVATSSLSSGDAGRAAPAKPVFRTGQRVHWPGQGLGSVVAIEDRQGKRVVMVEMDTRRRLGVELDKAADVLWALPSRERALELKKRLLAKAHPDPRELEARYPSIMKVLVDGAMEERVELVRREWSRSQKRSFGERRIDDDLARDVVAPIAEALGEDAAALRREAMEALRSGALEAKRPAGVFECPSPPASKAAPIQLPQAEYVGTFRTRAGLVVADPIYVGSASDGQSRAQKAVLNTLVESKPATWHVFVRDGASFAKLLASTSVEAKKALKAVADSLPDEGMIVEVLVVRDGATAAVVKKESKQTACVWVDGGSLAIMDAARRDDSAVADVNKFCERGPIVREHGLLTPSGAGDGTYPVSVVEDEKGVAVVRVQFDPFELPGVTPRQVGCGP